MSNRYIARIAGILYLIGIVTGIFGYMYVPLKLTVTGDASATFNNISSSESLFRLGAVGELVCDIFGIFVPLVLYKLLKQVNKIHALLMLILGEAAVPIALYSLLNKFSILSLISGADNLTGFEIEQLQAQVTSNLELYDQGMIYAAIFWVLWLFPFGYLIFKSDFLPKILGIMLMTGVIGCVVQAAGLYFISNFEETIISTIFSLVASLAGIGEISTCLWMLIMGAKDYPSSL